MKLVLRGYQSYRSRLYGACYDNSFRYSYILNCLSNKLDSVKLSSSIHSSRLLVII